MPDYRIRGIPPAVWRIVRTKSGGRVDEAIKGLLQMYADGAVDPLARHGAAKSLEARWTAAQRRRPSEGEIP